MLLTDQIPKSYCQFGLFDSQGKLLSGDGTFVSLANIRVDAIGEPVERIGDLMVLRRPIEGLSLPSSHWVATPSAAFFVARFDGEILKQRLDLVGVAYGLSTRQINLIEALLDTGALYEAAELLDVPYGSARNMLAEIKSKTGLATIPLIVGTMFELIGGETALDRVSGDRHNLFGLTERQYGIACAIGILKTRGEIAKRLGISEAVVDAELKTIYLVLGVRSAGEVTRFVAEARLSLAQAAPARATINHRLGQPHAMIINGSRTLGYSDFGPQEGRPVFILHSTITSRAPPTRLVTALQLRGFRPIAIDRPGFGDTDAGHSGGDPYDLATEDLALLCNVLGLSKVDVIARGSGQAAMRLAQWKPELIGRAILVNPTPAVAFTTHDRGPLGAVKRRFARSPRTTEVLIRLLAGYANPRRLHDGMTRGNYILDVEEPMAHDLIRQADAQIDEIVITPEMIVAGALILRSYDMLDQEEMARLVFQGMVQAGPKQC